MASQRKVRYKKLNVKTPLPALLETEIDSSEYESLTTEDQIATGVEANEETEVHLQTIIQGAGTSGDNEIPVPPPEESQLDYDSLYPAKFSQTSNYIRFSQTVEESIGCQYNITEEDEAFLKSYNQKRAPPAQLSEDEFEQIMEVFEDTASISTPFASVDKTVVPYDVMLQGLSELDVARIMPHAKEIYEYWKSQRQEQGGHLQPSLKFETHQEADEMDSYVCFRRREVRQTRKTRARDVQSADKLKRLRRELEDGRQLILLSHERELSKRDILAADRRIFEQRAKLKETKIRLGIKTDDSDLIHEKPQKRKAADLPISQRPVAPQLRMPVRPDGRAAEIELPLLRDMLEEKENEMRIEIENKIENHRRWNLNHVDLTRDPLGPAQGHNGEMGFRPAKTQYLMTPPASASSESMDENEPENMDLDQKQVPPVRHFVGMPSPEQASASFPSYRRRIGRLGRLWIDRRGMATPPRESSAAESDRWKYDQEEDSDDEPSAYEVDPYDIRALKFRATIPLFSRRPDSASHGGAPNNSGGPAGRPALPPNPQQNTVTAT